MANASGRDGSYLVWMVFASLIVVGVSTLLQARQIGPVGGGAMLPMFTAAFSIPFCVSAVQDGGPATLMALVLVSAVVQLIISRWLLILRRVVTPIVGGTVMMILSITLASVVFALLDNASTENPGEATLTSLVTLLVIATLGLRKAPALRLWGPLIGIVIGCVVAVFVGIYDFSGVMSAPWIGIPTQWPGLEFAWETAVWDISFWALMPSFVFLGVIISIQSNGASIATQRIAWREDRAVDFRQVQSTITGVGVSNLIAALFGAVPNIINPGTVSFIQTTGVAARRVGYVIGFMLVALAFVPKASALISAIPGPVLAGYLLMVTGALFVDGARTVMQNESDPQKIAVAGVCFWIGAAFQFHLFHLPDLGPVVAALFKSGITTGGFATIAMILYLEFTSPRRMRFQSKLDIDALPQLNDFMAKFAASRKWDDVMQNRLSAVAEETLLTLAPLDFDALDAAEDDDDDADKQLVVVAASDEQTAVLEFIGGGGDDQTNIEDRVRQLREHDAGDFVENELSLQLLRAYALSVQHQQYQGTDIITVRVSRPSD